MYNYRTILQVDVFKYKSTFKEIVTVKMETKILCKQNLVDWNLHFSSIKAETQLLLGPLT